MKYFKLIENNLIVGVVTSDNFMHYNVLTDNYIRANEQIGEYVNYNGKFYRDDWMQPFIHKAKYQNIVIMEIDEQEYSILYEALKVEQEIEYAQEINDNTEEPEIYEDTISIDFIRSSKIKEMSYECNKTIERGFDIETEDGTHHYSYALEDQLNLMNLSSMIAQGANELSYHADGELCRFYTPEEINEIISAGNAWKTYHTTYFNALKSYINSLETIEEISAITYGVDIPDEFKTDVLKILEY